MFKFKLNVNVFKIVLFQFFKSGDKLFYKN